MRTVDFGSLFQFIRNGLNVKQSKSASGLPISRIETISDASVDGTRVGYADLAESECRDWLLVPGDILFSHINSVEHVGKCAVYRGEPEKLVHGMNLLCLRSDESQLHPEFAKYLIRSMQFRSKLSSFINKAVNQASVSIGNLKTIRVTVPTLPEQRRIAEVLDRGEALRVKRRAALVQLDTLTQSIFLDIFGDPATNPKGWPVGALRDLGHVVTGSTPPSANEGMFGGPIPFITPGDLESDEPIKRSLTTAGAEESRTVGAGATLVCCIGAIGKIGRSTVRSAFNQQINAVEWGERIHPEYGYAVMRFFKPTIVAWSASTTVPILKKSAFERVEIPIPPVPTQERFARRVQILDRIRTANRAALKTSGELFSSLQATAFRGGL